MASDPCTIIRRIFAEFRVWHHRWVSSDLRIDDFVFTTMKSSIEKVTVTYEGLNFALVANKLRFGEFFQVSSLRMAG